MDGEENGRLTCVQCGRPVRLEIAKRMNAAAVHAECTSFVYTANNQRGGSVLQSNVGNRSRLVFDASSRHAQKSPTLFD